MRNVARQDLSETSHGLFETHKSYDPRVIFFYFVVALLIVLLIGGLAYQQLLHTDLHERREKYQNQRRILIPGPRGDIYDRNGILLVGNRPRFSVVLYLDELRTEMHREHIRIHNNYLAQSDDKADMLSASQLQKLARVSVAQRYLDLVNHILGRDKPKAVAIDAKPVATDEKSETAAKPPPALKIDPEALEKHFRQRLLLPFTLIDDLTPEEYARLLERLPVGYPVQVYTSSTRYYPFGSAAAHVLGYIGSRDDIDAEGFPEDELKIRTFKMKGTAGRDGLEKKFDEQLQGEVGGSIFRVDPAGFRVDPPLYKQTPTQGKRLMTSLDIDLQRAAENYIGDETGAAVAIDVKTGEVLVMCSKPDYNLSDMSPRFSQATHDEIEARGAWLNNAVYGFHPGSTFKILSSIAGLRSGRIDPDTPITNCQSVVMIGNRTFVCENRQGHHGEIKLSEAISRSCDIYFYKLGEIVTPDLLAAEARRFHLDQKTGIELPFESNTALIPDPDWKQRYMHEKWFPGDTANMAIGQGFTLITPLNMACFAASVARNETVTVPTLVHRSDAPTQHSEAIGLTAAQRTALIEGMEGVVKFGTASTLTTVADLRVPARVAGKTGTAQKKVSRDGKTGFINYAWFMCFAPVENPEIAVAVVLEGDTIGENYGGGSHAAPVAATILRKYFEKKNRPTTPGLKVSTSP